MRAKFVFDRFHGFQQAAALAACLMIASHAAAQTEPPSIRVGPFLQQGTPTSIWIVWETTSGDESRVDYGTSEALGSSANGEVGPGKDATRIHQTQLTGLIPDTTYFYRVTTAGAVGGLEHFRTQAVPEAEQSFRFVAYSDNQRDDGNPTKHGEVVREGIVRYVNQNYGSDLSRELAFVLNAGDLVDDGWKYEDWKGDYFDEAQPLISRIPSYPVLGNHEGTSPYFFQYFRLPANGTPGFLEHWWYHDHGNVRIIGLDSNDFFRWLPGQETWLQGVLDQACADPYIDFVFAELHHPFKSELWLPGETDFTGRVIQRMERFSTECKKPSIHFFGHTHAYSRGQSRDHQHLWVNVASAEGNIDYWGEEPNADYPEFQRSLPEWGFALVEVESGAEPSFTLKRISRGNEIEPRDNELRDQITIRLHARGPEAPVALEPLDVVGPVAPESLRLAGSAYAHPDGRALLESHFQVSTVDGDWSNPVAERWLRVENWYAPPGATGRDNGYYSVNTVTDPDVTHADITGLPPSTQLFWRVRYRDAGLMWSEWSAPAPFETGPSSLGPNLLVNAGAEDGTTGWLATLPPLESLESGACASPAAPQAGARFFAVGGVCAGQAIAGRAIQLVDVSAYAAAIDAGKVSASFGGWVRDRSGDDDKPDIWLTFRPVLGKELGRTSKYWARSAAWSHRSDVVAVPPGTRSVEMTLWGTRLVGQENDSYFDSLHLAVGNAACAADLDGDGEVGEADRSLAESGLGACVPGRACPGDRDGDGTVTSADVDAIVAAYGPCAD